MEDMFKTLDAVESKGSESNSSQCRIERIITKAEFNSAVEISQVLPR